MRLLGRLREPTPDLVDKIKKLEQRISNLETNSRIGNTSVDTGSFRVNTGETNKFQVYVDGIKQMQIGSEGGVPDIRIWRPNGLTAFFMTRFANRDIIGLQDDNLHTIVGDDAVSGFGLARPFIPVPFYDDLQFAPARTTTSATFTNLQWATYNIQHPWLYITSLVRCSDGTTGGEIIVNVNGNTVLPTTTTIPVGSNALFDQFINFATYGTGYGGNVEVTIAARRTAGVGTIGVRTVYAYGRESPL